ncbi:DUF350 domain-containing protein [Tuwongella immobilis]|uniref:DUF350 domain-containing protein n=1 Tax=Tuwongella immobilis TaxID=692036 RepID=A0A6C2YYC2_9BACT|nr:DUF350 domain-containing protein [Tuwongella immobilis]VIP05725.1 Uncharacterized protein OS=Clostridium sp. BL8 GN=M918_14395 PE=4 SV=1: DUF350 [Tuwongella immobilis]VTS08806.1 Uncharacterized protein OS=Clostridium sp. BL8 GN=M918_14395 PE=4 SV=1: DUF350 [Tuwongella immobilis]
MLPEGFWAGLLASVIYGLTFIGLLLFGFKLFDWITPSLDIQKRLDENPLAVGIVVGAFMIAIALIVSSVVH